MDIRCESNIIQRRRAKELTHLQEKFVQTQIPQLRQCLRRRSSEYLLSHNIQWVTSSNGIITGGALAYADALASCSVRNEKAFTSSEELAVLIVEIQRPVAELWNTFGGIRLRV